MKFIKTSVYLRMRIFPLFLFLFATCTLVAQPVVKEKTLANGFRIYVVENHDQPSVYGAVAVRAGSKNDPADATGMAHYLEHMLFKGTNQMGTIDYANEKIWLDSITFYYEKLGTTKDEAKRLSIQLKINELSLKAAEYAIPNEIDRMLAQIGSTGVNAYTTVESTVYHNTFPSNQLEKWMEIYSHRFENPVFRLFQSELEIVYEEKNRKMDDMGSSIFELYLKNFFKHHPYGQQTTIGETQHLKNPSLSKMYEYFKTYYVPNNMALIICGDVNTEEVFALAEKKFGDWVAHPVPDYPTFKEPDFNGKETIKIRRTPVKAGVLGFRIPGNRHEDIIALDMIAELMSNSSSSGSIDRLVNDGELFFGGLQYMPYNDMGAAFLYFVPKIIGQSMRKAEKKVVNCLDEIKNGNFSDEALEAFKTNRIKQIELSSESNTSTASHLTSAFIKGISPNEYYKEVDQIKSITREKIIEVANKYFGENCLAMYSRMGFPKKDKLQKPPFKPVKAKTNEHSSYFNQWSSLPSKVTIPRFVDFKTDVDSVQVNPNFMLYRNINMTNQVASLSIIFGTGKHYIPALEYLDEYLMNCGTANLGVNDFNARMHALGCSWSVECSAHQFIVKLNFPEGNIEKVLHLIRDLFRETSINSKSKKKVIRDAKMDYRVNKRSPDYYADALNAYAVYGEKSSFIDKMSIKSFNKLDDKSIREILDQVWKSGLKVYYCGSLPNNTMKDVFKKCNFMFERVAAQPMYFPDKIELTENRVYLLKIKRARQNQINLVKIGNHYSTKDAYAITGFNKYFGGDMSSLLFQEIRELRSLAYSTHASYSVPAVQGKKCLFTASAGTQNDKTMECVNALFDLVNHMPVVDNRFPVIKQSLMELCASSRPGFRNMVATVEGWKRKGYTDDPNKENLLRFGMMSMKDITDFYNENIRDKKSTLCITGKTKSLNKNELKKYGTLTTIKRKRIVKK